MSKKTKQISARIDEQNYQAILDHCKQNNISMSEYILIHVIEPNDENYIAKKTLIPHLLRISETLDKNNLKESRTVKLVRKEFEKVWSLL
ncbi:MAG: hypothetical protein LUC98_09065 [Lachnospiraceae bacterium]|nr:hypothetical protein [Lachnospiraceae bacterium]